MRSSSLARSAPALTGLIPQPESDQVAEHAGSAGEESLATLAKRTSSAAAPRADADLSGDEQQPADQPTAPSAEQEADKQFKIVRATTRLRVDFSIIEKRVSKDVADQARLALRDGQRMAITVANVIMRAVVRDDTAALDAFLVENGRAPLSKEWPFPTVKGYQLGRAVCPRLSTGIVSAIDRMVHSKWRQSRYDALVRQTCSPPHYRTGGTFPVRAQEVTIRKIEDGLYGVALAIHDGRGVRFEIPVEMRDEHQNHVLAMLATGKWKHGNVVIEQDRIRKSRWYLRVGYTRFVEKRVEGIAGSINKGINAFFAAYTADGDELIEDGNQIEAYLKQVQRRRRSYQHALQMSLRGGHGRKRTLRPIKPLEEKAERWRRTMCQTMARQLARWFSARKVNVVYIDDMTGIRDGEPEKLEGGKAVWNRIQEWPYYQFQMRLTSCLEEEGIRAVIVPAVYISQRCPQCGTVNKDNRDLRTWRLRCQNEACNYVRHLDVAAAQNVLARGEAISAGGTGEFDELAKEGAPKRGGARKPRRKR
jgi:transposase